MFGPKSMLVIGLLITTSLANIAFGADGASDAKITSPDPFQVIQRTSEHAGDIACSGRSAQGVSIRARITKDGQPLEGMEWQEITQWAKNSWSGVLKGVPVGGPYTVEFEFDGVAAPP